MKPGMKTGAKVLLGLLGLAAVAAVSVVLWVRAHPLAVWAALGRRTLAKAGFVESGAPAPAGEVRYLHGGSGPPLVLLHGAGADASSFARVAPALAKGPPGHRVIVPDLPGHGLSGPAKGPLTIEILLAGLDAVLAQEVPKGPVVVCGNSLGAWLAVLWSIQHPGRVERLVLVDGGPMRHSSPGLTLTPKNRGEARKLLAALRDPASPPVPDFVVDDIIRRANGGAIARIAQGAGSMEKWLLDGRLQEVTAPVELVWGASDKVVPLSYAETLLAGLPAARLTKLPECGHIPSEECPDLLAKVLGDLLRQPPPAPRPAAVAGREAP